MGFFQKTGLGYTLTFLFSIRFLACEKLYSRTPYCFRDRLWHMFGIDFYIRMTADMTFWILYADVLCHHHGYRSIYQKRNQFIYQDTSIL